MKYLLLLFIFVSCGKSPLFGKIDDADSPNKIINSASATDEYVWADKRLHFGIVFNNKPEVGIDSTFKLKFWDSYQTNFLGPYQKLEEKLCVFLWMIMPDGSQHGSSPLSMELISTEEDKYYQFKDVYFLMNGHWQVRIRTVENQTDCQSLKTDPYLEEAFVDLYL